MPLHKRKVLAVDASTERCSVALNVNGDISSCACDVPKTHAQALLPMVDDLLASAQLPLNQLDAIAVTLGPGSFTGVRICLSIVQGLAYGAKLPVVGRNSLELMAQGQTQKHHPNESLYVSCLDARMGEVYWAVFAKQSVGQLDECLKEISQPRVSSPLQFNAALDKLGLQNKGSVFGVGHGFHVEGIDSSLFTSVANENLPQARDMFALWQNDDAFDLSLSHAQGKTLEPLYLRNEVAWEKRKRIRAGVE